MNKHSTPLDIVKAARWRWELFNPSSQCELADWERQLLAELRQMDVHTQQMMREDKVTAAELADWIYDCLNHIHVTIAKRINNKGAQQ